MSIEALLGGPLRVVNIGLESFARDLAANRAAVAQVDWSPPSLPFDEKIEPVAIMPDGVIQKVRVAAMSAVGARYLAPERPKVLGLFGSGWQASAHLEFLAAQYKFDQIKVFSPNQEHCREFCRGMSEKLGCEVRSVGTPKEAVDGSDFVQAATAAIAEGPAEERRELPMSLADLANEELEEERFVGGGDRVGVLDVHLVRRVVVLAAPPLDREPRSDRDVDG